MRRKTIILIIAAIMTSAFFGCSKDNKNVEEDKGKVENSTDNKEDSDKESNAANVDQDESKQKISKDELIEIYNDKFSSALRNVLKVMAMLCIRRIRLRMEF